MDGGNSWVWFDGSEYDYVGDAHNMDIGECIYIMWIHSTHIYYILFIDSTLALTLYIIEILIYREYVIDIWNIKWWTLGGGRG